MVISHLHADHILDLVPFASALTYAPRQQPVPVDGWPGTDTPARPRLHAPPGAATPSRACAAAAGCTSSTSRTPSTLTSTPPDDVSRSARWVRFQPVPHFLPTHAVEVREGGPPHLQRRLLAQRGPQRVRARHRPAADRGHAAAARARRPARPPDALGGRRARPPRGRQAARAHPSLGRAGRRLGAGRGRAGLRRAGRSGPRRRRLRGLSAYAPIKRGPLAADACRVGVHEPSPSADGVRLLSHRPSVLYKVEHMATEPVEGDIAVEGAGARRPGWADRLKELLTASPSPSAPACSPSASPTSRPCRCPPTRCSTAAARTGSRTSSRTAR